MGVKGGVSLTGVGGVTRMSGHKLIHRSLKAAECQKGVIAYTRSRVRVGPHPFGYAQGRL